MSRSKLDIEADTALGIAKAMVTDLAELERWWPLSKRGSNAQRCLDSIKARRDTIEQCLRDAVDGDQP